MMVVSLGGKPLADFSQPIEMMMDCHRRIEHFLNLLNKVHVQFGVAELTEEARRALVASQRYFSEFAPRHSADEEESLFPRLRCCTSPEAAEAMALLDRLERDHRRCEAGHALIDRIVRLWLDNGRIDDAQLLGLQQTLDELALTYAAHIQLEENRIFVLAIRELKPDQIHDIGEEMKRRRQINDVAVDAGTS